MSEPQGNYRKRVSHKTEKQELKKWVNSVLTENIEAESYSFDLPARRIEEIPAYNPTQVNIDTFLDFTENDGENVWCASVKRFFSVAFDKYGYSIYNGRDKVEGAFFPPGMDFTAKKKAVQEAFTRFYKSDV